MKVAICLSGQLRSYRQTFPYFKNFLMYKLNPDIFLFSDRYEKELKKYNPKNIGIQKEVLTNNFDFKIKHSSTKDISLISQ